ncbi:MAG TPA: exodeoxyribonuclease VII large subunit [Verrucomicrobiae bacterium]
MPKDVTTQWDFDDLFYEPSPKPAPHPVEAPAQDEAAPTQSGKSSPPPNPVQPGAGRKILSVSELTANLRQLFERQIGFVWVTGEITNFRLQTSGHIYFTLKDANAQLSCVLFRGELIPNRDLLEDGQKVLLQGQMTIYEVRGQYQLRVTAVELQGIGALQIAFDRLKQKLQAEGLFAAERKRALPKYPQFIGIVTSPSGAAIRDVLHVIERRQPGLEILLASCRVQGAGAAEEIACAIQLLNDWSNSTAGNKIDLILVTRGGGSLEDLWAFNEEVVARAIFNSKLPVVSAVGHEIDFTISDFVADLRAATPSAAAELITEGAFASRKYVAETADYMHLMVTRRVREDTEALEQLADRLERVHPRRFLEDKSQHLDDLNESLCRCLKHGYRHAYNAWLNLERRLYRARPSQGMSLRSQMLKQLDRRLHEQARVVLKEPRAALATLSARLRLLSPENVLARGYSITTDATSGKIIRAAEEAKPNQDLKIKLHKGGLKVKVQ